jgi:hypothetical protein
MASLELRNANLTSLIAIVVLALPSPAHAAHRYVPFDTLAVMDFAHEPVGLDDLRFLSSEELALLRGVVFGRHGRVFRNDRIQLWLESQAWYRPDPGFRNESLDEVERANLDRIRRVEAEKHEFIQPGDLRWWQDRLMSADGLGPHSPAEWAVLRAEVEAVHGRRFDGEPWLQHYFDERYWYRPVRHYDAGTLSDVERRNLELLDSLVRARGAGAVGPCEMGFYEERPLTATQLHGSSFATLRILRNEVYARHGMGFHAEDLAEWFANRDWYVFRESVEVRLSPMEQRNVATIAAYERALRDSLRTRPLDPALLEGLFAEDARRLRLGILARHGRVFRRRWEQDYVASLSGYRPDPGYSDARLSDLERANIAAIVAYEKTAASVRDAVEG